MSKSKDTKRVVPAVHANAQVSPDPEFELGMAEHLRQTSTQEELTLLLGRHCAGGSQFDRMMRRILWHALCPKIGQGLKVEENITVKHIETFELGDNVFIGAQSIIQGRFDGRCQIGSNVWIGPHSYFDARDLILEDYVGWGPGAKVIGSEHTAMPVDQPILKTDLEILPVRVCKWADIGANAVLLPGITVGEGAIVGAGAIVTADVEPYAVVAGVPAKVLRYRK
ncbi:MAG: acyltransferase [Candidatus Obscuribacterales bacterium]|nr:acyltransferase [Candidatus Obscuribacterales bacterium]